MSVAHQFRDGMKFRVNSLFQNTIFRYLFGIAAVASVFALRIWLIPLTGTGAPYVLFFAAVLVTSLFAGVGPAICAVLLSMPLGAYTFVVGAGYSIAQASFQSLLFAVDGIVVICLTFLTRKAARSLQTAVRQVRESEEKYRSLFDSIDQGFCVVEVLFDDADNALDYRFLEVNRVFEQQTGISNAVGRRMREIAPAHEEHWFQIYGQIALTGESRRFENPAHALGRFYDVYAFRVGRPEQRRVAILFNDITTRKQIEEALHESEERLALAMEAGRIGTFDWDIRTNAVVWTEQSKSVFASPSGTARGVYADWAKRVRPEDLLVCEASIQEAFRKKRHQWQAEYRVMSSDTAKERWINSQSHIFYDAQGEPLRMVGVNIDITERKRIERTLHESEERFRLTIDEAPIGMALETLDGRFVRVNRALCEIVGYSSAELTRLTVRAITHPDDRDADLAFKGQLARGEIPRYQLGKRYIRKDGGIVHIQLSCSILRSRDGAPFYYIAQIEDITDRTRAEAARKDSEGRLSLALDSAQMGTWDLDLLTDTSVRSLRHDEIFGYSAAVPTWGAAVFMTHVVPEDRDVAKHAFETAFVSDNFDMECRIRWPDGSIHWISAKGRVYRNPKGDPVRMMGTVLDVTERKRAEEQLRAANVFLDAIIENIPLMLFIKESQSLRFIRVNRTGEDLLGWANQTLIGKTAYDFWPKEQAEFFIEKDRETLSHGSVVDIPEEPIQTRHQGVRILHTKKVPILDTAGNPLYLLGISEDITERKRIEAEQQFLAQVSVALSTSLEYEQTLANLARLAVQSVADWFAVDVMDEDGRLSRLKVASADPRQAALCAVLEQMPPNRDLPHLMRSVSESKRPIVIEQVTSTYIESLGQGHEHRHALLAAGVTSFLAVPLLMRGQPLGALFLGSSTPSRVFRQGDLRWAEALADRAAMAIENARLYRSSVYATQLRDQVLGVVAHDLRNPLSAILLQTSALKRHGPEPERRSQEPVEAIHRTTKRMNRLIQDLLDVALMEAGQLTIEPARLSAGGLIADAVDMQRSLASSSSLELRVEVDPDVAEVWGDRNRLLQVFENLIGNAIKFTQAGGRITAGATSRDDEVVFWVADTGCGIPSENLPRVFDRFWQATRTGRQGAGLGLPITKGIVEAHGGRIWIESTAGSGSTFFFTIPRVSAAEERLPDRHRRDRVA
jgi:PAS domain S-box-containing protein